MAFVDDKPFEVVEGWFAVGFQSNLVGVWDPVAQLLLLVCLRIDLESLEVDEQELWESADCHFFRGDLFREAGLTVQLVVPIEQLFDRESLEAVAQGGISLDIDAEIEEVFVSVRGLLAGCARHDVTECATEQISDK